MSETKIPYIIPNAYTYEVTGVRRTNFPVDSREYAPLRALAKAYDIPITRLIRLVVGIGLQHVTPEQIIQVRDARLKALGVSPKAGKVTK